MMSEKLESLLIQNLSDLDQAVLRIKEIENRVFSEMDNFCLNWSRKQGWISEADYSTNKEWDGWNHWLAPPDWRTRNSEIEQNYFDGCFELSLSGGDDGQGAVGCDWFYLTRLCQSGKGHMGFIFVHSQSLTTRKWKKIFPQIQSLAPTPPFFSTEINQSPTFFLPFKIDATDLARAFEEEEPLLALRPFEDALNALLQTKPQLDLVVEQIRAAAAS